VLGGAGGGHAHRRAGQGNANPRKTREGEASERRNAGAAGQRKLLLERQQLDHGRKRQEPQGSPRDAPQPLDILPSLVSDATTLESGDGEDYYSGQEGGGPGGIG
jgi:hypothetical protein